MTRPEPLSSAAAGRVGMLLRSGGVGRPRAVRIASVVALLAVLALASCSTPEATVPGPVETPTPTAVADASEMATVEEGVAYVLGRPAGTMTSDEVMDAAMKLRPLAEGQFSQASLGDAPRELVKITIDGLDFEPNEAAPELQARLAEIAKRLREIG